MKFVTLATIASVSAQDQLLAGPSTGLLNYHWTEGYHCPDFVGKTPMQNLKTTTTPGAKLLTFENWSQHCAELAYGLTAEEAPCMQAIYLPGGATGFGADPTVNEAPFYGCMAFEGEYL